MTKLTNWLYALFESYILEFLTVMFPNTTSKMSYLAIKNVTQTQADYSKKNLYRTYRRNKSKQVSFRIFYLRVRYFGWEVEHAICTPDRKNDLPTPLYSYSRKELFNNATVHHRPTEKVQPQ